MKCIKLIVVMKHMSNMLNPYYISPYSCPNFPNKKHSYYQNQRNTSSRSRNKLEITRCCPPLKYRSMSVKFGTKIVLDIYVLFYT